MKYLLFLGIFHEWAKQEGAAFIATGHYAQTNAQGELMMARDKLKDQTYFLSTIQRSALRNTLFPIGHLVKSQVKQIALENRLPVANKKESVGICMVTIISLFLHSTDINDTCC